MMILLLNFIFLPFVLSIPHPYECPWNVAGDYVSRATFRTVDTYPASVLKQTNTTISARFLLGGTPILKEKMFLTSKSDYLGYLDLSNKGINHIQQRAFFGLNCLRELNLSTNNIRTLEGEELFTGLGHLESLDLSHNEIFHMDGGVFTPLYNLIYLNLSHNRLVDLDDNDAFEGLGNVRHILLSHNKLKRLDVESFEILTPHLTTLDIANNAFPTCIEYLAIREHLWNRSYQTSDDYRYETCLHEKVYSTLLPSDPRVRHQKVMDNIDKVKHMVIALLVIFIVYIVYDIVMGLTRDGFFRQATIRISEIRRLRRRRRNQEEDQDQAGADENNVELR